MRSISIPSIGITLITASESRTVCIVSCADSRSPPRVTVARAFCIRHVCHAGTAGCTSSGFVSATFFFAPQPANTKARQATHMNLFNRIDMFLYFFA